MMVPPLAARSVLHYPLLAQQISEERSGVYWENQWEQLQREPAQAFDPATIKHEGNRVCGRVSGLALD